MRPGSIIGADRGGRRAVRIAPGSFEAISSQKRPSQRRIGLPQRFAEARLGDGLGDLVDPPLASQLDAPARDGPRLRRATKRPAQHRTGQATRSPRRTAVRSTTMQPTEWPIQDRALDAGRSTKPEGPYWSASAEDLERMLDRLGVDGAILIGHSVGSMVVEHTAVRLGDRVLGLAMLGGALQWRPEAGPVFERRVELAREGRMDEIAHTVAQTGLSERCRESNPALLGLFLELIASNDPDAYADCSAATAAARMIGAASPVRRSPPAASSDPVTPPAFAEAIVAEMPGGRTAVVKGAAHWCQLEAPADVNGLLLRFLDEIAT